MEQAVLLVVKISGILNNGFIWEIEEIKKRFLDKSVFCIDIYDKKTYDIIAFHMQKSGLNFPMQDDIFSSVPLCYSFKPNGQFDACARLDLHPIYLNCRQEVNKNKKNVRRH